MLHPFDEIAQALHALPKGFDAGFTIAFSAEEPPEHGDLENNFANRRNRRWHGLLGQNTCSLKRVAGRPCLIEPNSRAKPDAIDHFHAYCPSFEWIPVFLQWKGI